MGAKIDKIPPAPRAAAVEFQNVSSMLMEGRDNQSYAVSLDLTTANDSSPGSNKRYGRRTSMDFCVLQYLTVQEGSPRYTFSN